MICQDWIDADYLINCDCPDASEVIVNQAIGVASEVLYVLSGRQYSGLCQETMRPCSGNGTIPTGWPYPYFPNLSNGVWLNVGCGCHTSYDCCGGVPQVDLGRHDVTQIFNVDIDGATLSASSYRLDEGRYLVRTDGSSWPCCQDLSKDIGETGTWYIELEHGEAPPEMGQYAAGRLASELIKSCTDGADCALPARVTTVAREGVTFSLLDPQDFLTEGRTGLYEVDLFLSAVNPAGLRRRATAWTPGMPGRARRVGVINS